MIHENDPAVDTILLSSEDARFVEAHHNYSSTSWRFVINSKDVMQASGDRQKLNGHSMDDVFMSFYTTLQMQVMIRLLACMYVSAEGGSISATAQMKKINGINTFTYFATDARKVLYPKLRLQLPRPFAVTRRRRRVWIYVPSCHHLHE